MINVKDSVIIEACKNSCSMAEAAAKTNLHYNTFNRKAKILGVYNPNQGRRGRPKPKTEGKGKIPLQEILDGLHPQYQTFKLKKRLIKAGIKENKCEICGLSEWNSKTIECELDHINGNRTDHSLDNLIIICPNCHSQTETFRGKRKVK